jgi:iron complex outermembrane recepter protein
MTKQALLAGASAILVFSAHGAAAQTTASPSAAPQATAPDTPSNTDIVVTATRDRSLLSKTPVALTAVTGDTLRSAGVVGPSGLKDLAPSISIDHTDGLQITIRGVTSTDQTEKGDPSAAFMTDGVYIARTQEADVSFYDVERVEVLRGPQGTLYGKNTTAGVVNVISNKPKLDKFEVVGNTSVGNYNAYSGDLAVNVPINSIMAARVALDYDRHDNYLKLGPGDNTQIGPQRNNFASRVQLLIEPSDTFNLLLRSEYAKLTGTQAGLTSLRQTNFYTISGNPATGQATALWINPSTDAALTRTNPVPTEPGVLGNGTTKVGEDNEAYSFEGEANWNLGHLFTLTDIASYRHFSRAETGTSDLGLSYDLPTSFNGSYHQVSNELRLSTNGDGPLKVQAGFYYFREREDIALYLFGLLNPTPGAPGYVYGFPQSPVINRTLAGFTQAVFKPIPSVRITAGLRYTDDYKYRYGHTVILSSVDQPISQSSGYVNDALIKSQKLTWRAGIDGDVPGGLAYASVATGYKAGGFGDGCSTGGAGQSQVTSQGEPCVYSSSQPQAIYYKPETLTAYEIGYKGKMFGNVLRINADVFYYDYKNLQLSGIVNVAGAPSTVTTNAGKASIKGLELEGILSPNRYNRLTFGLDLLDAHYTQYCPHVDTAGVCDDNWAGNRLDRSPATVVRAAYVLTVPTHNDGRIEASAGTQLSSKYYVTGFYAYPLQFVTPSHTTTDVSVTYHAPGDRWYIQGFAKNLENFITVNGVSTFGNVTAFGDPRTFGARAGFKF